MSYFEQMYARSADPWHLSTTEYEQRKYDVTVACLPRRRYARAFEPGCSVGVLTAMLAQRCDELLASDLVAAPLREVAARVPGDNVVIEQRAVPADWPDGTFDLVVLSELLYFLDEDDRRGTLERVLATLRPDGHLVLVHWLHRFDEATCTGDYAHREVAASTALERVVRHEETDFLLEVFSRAPS